MRIAIYDTDKPSCVSLRNMICSASRSLSLSCAVTEYALLTDLVYDVQDNEWFDLVFLNVDGGSEEILQTVKTLREWRFIGGLVLTSLSGDEAISGYEIGACGYLLKPFDAQRVKDIVEKVCKTVKTSYLTVSHHRTIRRIPYRDILYAESRNSKCVIHCVDGVDHIMYCHLEDLHTRLSDPRFLRCHQSFLVNMDHIVGVDKAFTLVNGDIVCIRQRQLKQMRETYLAYIGEEDRCPRTLPIYL